MSKHTSDLLEACKMAERIELIRDEMSSNLARLNDRSGTVESHRVARENNDALRAELRTIRQSLRAAIARAEGGAP